MRLSTINIELSSRCDKSCHFCGHQNAKVNPALVHGDMDLELFAAIVLTLPSDVVIQLHRDGEPLVYPYLGAALRLLRYRVSSLVTNGKKLGALAGVILEAPPTSLCVSMFRDDPDGDDQLRSLIQFLDWRGGRRQPMLLVKIVGEDLDTVRMATVLAWERAGLLRVIRRSQHHPGGDHHYRQAQPPIPELGVCLDLLHHPSIDWQGNVYLCNRLDPERRNLIGTIAGRRTLDDILDGPERLDVLRAHLRGDRAGAAACAGCEFWGIPAS